LARGSGCRDEPLDPEAVLHRDRAVRAARDLKLALYQTWTIKRGRILAADGTVLAASVAAGRGTWRRRYPTGPLFAQAVGYANVEQGQFAGLERAHNAVLTATQESTLGSVFGPISESSVGDDLYTTLDPRAQALARTLLAGRVGSVVAIVPQTGAVPVMYSNPSYDPLNPRACGNQQIDGIGCQVNLATQARMPPGSTFKIVTTAAALDTGRYTPSTLIDGKSPLIVSGAPLENDGNASYGQVPLSFALTNSINTVYAQVGQSLGAATMQTYMHRFGFYSDPPLDYPRDQMVASGDLNEVHGGLLEPTAPPGASFGDTVDLGRMSIGQDKLGVTPLQMAMVAAAIANSGTLMTPHFVTKVVAPDGQIVSTVAPHVYSHVVKAPVAREMWTMMQSVVEEGTGTKANLEGLNAAGKTGTASIGATGSNIDDAWFIGFAPATDPKIAVAVEINHIVNGYGGTYAAPVAAQMMKTLLAEGL
jgi:peptidoglycan glycosyltransferase